MISTVAIKGKLSSTFGFIKYTSGIQSLPDLSKVLYFGNHIEMSNAKVAYIIQFLCKIISRYYVEYPSSKFNSYPDIQWGPKFRHPYTKNSLFYKF